MTLVERIKDLCKQNNLSINKLEQLAGLTSKSIGKWDTNSPSIDKVQKVADYFGISIDELLGRTPAQNKPDDVLEAASMKPGFDMDDLSENDKAAVETMIQALRDKNRK